MTTPGDTINATSSESKRIFRRIGEFLELIKFEHTIFALPFAYLGMLLAAGGWPGWDQFAWITVAMAAARTVAMGFNRITDRQIDARNPRTAARPLVTGAINPGTAWGGTLAGAALLILAAWRLGPLPLRLLPGAFLFLLGYSFTKRFTWLSHFVLGFTDGLAPLGAWAAVRGSLFSAQDVPAWLLLASVTLWIGGFDLIYACQDIDCDRQEDLQSIPARFGVLAALRLSALSHSLTVAVLASLGVWMGLRWPFWTGLLVTACLLAWEHNLVRPGDLSRIQQAFFNVNSMISVILFLSILGSLMVSS
jgi:4-hydroxybenzoate polyprenyltransferase